MCLFNQLIVEACGTFNKLQETKQNLKKQRQPIPNFNGDIAASIHKCLSRFLCTQGPELLSTHRVRHYSKW